MVVLDKRLILTPEIRSFFDLTIIDPSVGLVEVDKFAALGDSLYLFAITLLLYRAVRIRNTDSSKRILRQRTSWNATEGKLCPTSPSFDPQHQQKQQRQPNPQLQTHTSIFNIFEFFKPETSLTSIPPNFDSFNRNSLSELELENGHLQRKRKRMDDENGILLVDIGPDTTAANLTNVNERHGDNNDLGIDSHTGISITSVILRLTILFARSLDVPNNSRHPTFFRRALTDYEYVITILTLFVLLFRSRRRVTRHRLTHSFVTTFIYYLFPAFWVSILTIRHPWFFYPSFHIQFMTWSVGPNTSSNTLGSEPSFWDIDSESIECSPKLPFCRLLWAFAHLLGAVVEVPQLVKLNWALVGQKSALKARTDDSGEEVELRVGGSNTWWDEGVVVYAVLVPLSKFLFLPSYIVIFVRTKMYDPVLYLSQLTHVVIFGLFAITTCVQMCYNPSPTLRVNTYNHHIEEEYEDEPSKEDGLVTSTSRSDRSPLRERLHL